MVSTGGCQIKSNPGSFFLSVVMHGMGRSLGLVQGFGNPVNERHCVNSVSVKLNKDRATFEKYDALTMSNIKSKQ